MKSLLLLIIYVILFPFLAHAQDTPIHFVFYKLERFQHAKDTVFLSKCYKGVSEQMFYYVKISKNKWRGKNEDGIVEIGAFRRKFNFITPWWNIFTNPLQMKKVEVWAYYLPDSVDYVDYGKNRTCCHALYKRNSDKK